MRVPLIFSLIHLLFSAPPASAQLYADCDSAFWIGTQYKLHFTGAYGIGNNAEEAKRVECFFNGENYGQAEENSTWLRFAIEKAGTLRFTIQPDSLGDDYDFVLYRLPADGQCSKKKTIRCMASGANPVDDPNSPCLGATGLRDREWGNSADAGCSNWGDNAWLKPVPVKPGEQYVLLISNISHPINGFVIHFKGDFTFQENPE
jgi:hypothetical protein